MGKHKGQAILKHHRQLARPVHYIMFGVILFLLSLGFGQGALVLSRYNKEDRIEVKTSGLCGNSSLLYCDTPSAYPVDAISRALQRQTTMLDMFDKEEEILKQNNIVKRSVRDYYDACPSTKDLIMPRVGTNTQNQQRYLVNGAISREFGRLIQTVRVPERSSGWRPGVSSSSRSTSLLLMMWRAGNLLSSPSPFPPAARV